ncbi:MAG: sodium:solute symporter family protein [Phycisphaerae bacterium]
MEATAGLAIIFLFMLIPLGIGFYAASKSLNTSEDYFIQGRAMGSVAVFFTVAATWWSAFAFLGSNAYFYTHGPVYWTALPWNLLFGFMYFLIGRKVWQVGKKFGYITPSDLFGDRYKSEFLRILVGLIMIVFTVPYLQIQLMGGAYLIQVASGNMLPFWLAGLLFYVVIIVYVWVGGIRAVAWTDIFYGVLLFFGMIVAGFLVAGQVGGHEALFTKLAQSSPQHLTMPGPKGVMGYNMWLSLFLITPIGAIMGPQLWLRMYSVKSGKLFRLMPFLLGLAAIAYIGSLFAGFTGVLLEPGIANADQVLPTMLLKYAPFALASLLIAGGAAAAMSTANSQVHAIATIVTADFYKRYSNPKASQDVLIRTGRIALLAFSLAAYVLALFVPGLLVTIGLVALGGTAQVIVPTIGALYWKRSTAAGAIAGLIVGIAAVLLLTFVPGWNNPLGYHAGLWGLVGNAIVFVVVSLATAPRTMEEAERYSRALA